MLRELLSKLIRRLPGPSSSDPEPAKRWKAIVRSGEREKTLFLYAHDRDGAERILNWTAIEPPGEMAPVPTLLLKWGSLVSLEEDMEPWIAKVMEDRAPARETRK